MGGGADLSGNETIQGNDATMFTGTVTNCKYMCTCNVYTYKSYTIYVDEITSVLKNRNTRGA